MIAACNTAGVRRMVLVGALCAGRWLHPLNVFGLILVWKRLGEQCLAQSGLDWTLVRPGGLSENDGRADSIPKAWCLAARVRLDNQLN